MQLKISGVGASVKHGINRLIAFVLGTIKKLSALIWCKRVKIGNELFVLLVYFILTLIMLYPFSVLEMNTQLLGDGGDTFQGLWDLWWVKQSVLSLSNPFETNHIFYPIGTDLYVHSLSPAAGFFTIPFQLTFGLVFSYNLLIILSFVLAGYGAYRLSYYITGDKKAAFFSGLAFGFSAYHFARGWGHMNLVSIQWIPFYVLFLLKMRKDPSLKNVLFAVFFLVLTALMADLQYIVFLGMFTAILLIYDLLFNREHFWRFFMKLGIMTAVFLGIMVLIIGPFFYGMLTGEYAYAKSPGFESVLFSADLLGFFVPSSLNLFFGQYSQGIISQFSTSGIESIVYIGYTVLALAIFATVKKWKEAKLWLLGTFVFMILSLGPILHVLGETRFTSLNVNIALPELVLLSTVPILRVPSRFVLIATLCLAVLAAISLKHINTWFTKLKRGKILSLIFLICLSGAFLAEVNMVPYPVVEDAAVSPFYSELAKMEGTFAVLDLPQSYGDNNRYMYYSTVSEKPIICGTTSRIDPDIVQFLQAFPVIGQMEYARCYGNVTGWSDILVQDVNTANLNSFYYFNVGYVVLHRDLANETAFRHMDAYLRVLLGEPVFSDEQITAFSTEANSAPGTFALLKSGWWNIELRDGLPTRWTDGNGVFTVVSPTKQNYRISFFVGTDIEDKTMQVFLNDGLIDEHHVPTTERSIISFSVLLEEGFNQLSLYSERFSPINVTDSLDPRCLGVYIQNVEISPE